MKMILSFRMAEAQFIKALTGYFGFPLIITVAFVLLLFWICKYFNNNAQYQQNTQQGRVPPALPLRRIQNAIVTAFILAYPLFVVAAEETSPSTADNYETLPSNRIANRGSHHHNRGQNRSNHNSSVRQALRNAQTILPAMIIPHWITLLIGTAALFIIATTTLVCILKRTRPIGIHPIRINYPHPGEKSGRRPTHPGEKSGRPPTHPSKKSGRTSYLRSLITK